MRVIRRGAGWKAADLSVEGAALDTLADQVRDAADL
jgi:hypothetical protein